MLVIWTKDLRHPKTAPRDGRHFLGIRSGRAEPERMCWDAEMGCFLTEDFAMVDYLSSWVDAAPPPGLTLDKIAEARRVLGMGEVE